MINIYKDNTLQKFTLTHLEDLLSLHLYISNRIMTDNCMNLCYAHGSVIARNDRDPERMSRNGTFNAIVNVQSSLELRFLLVN